MLTQKLYHVLATGLRSLYSGDRLRETLFKHFGDTKMGDLTERPVWLIALNVTDGTPMRIRAETQEHLKLVDAACATAAFPVLFPLYTFWGYALNAGDLVADGGFIDNSTPITTLTRALNDAQLEPTPPPAQLQARVQREVAQRDEAAVGRLSPAESPLEPVSTAISEDPLRVRLDMMGLHELAQRSDALGFRGLP